MNKSNVILILITVPDEKTADSIATMLVDEKLAACVNVVPGLTSYYHWQDRLNKDSEFLLLVKTSPNLFEIIRETVLKLHPYDLPEIIALDISTGFQDYIDWIISQTKEETK